MSSRRNASPARVARTPSKSRSRASPTPSPVRAPRTRSSSRGRTSTATTAAASARKSTRTRTSSRSRAQQKEEDEEEDVSEVEEVAEPKAKRGTKTAKTKATPTRSASKSPARRKAAVDDDDDESEEAAPAKKASTKKATPKARASRSRSRGRAKEVTVDEDEEEEEEKKVVVKKAKSSRRKKAESEEDSDPEVDPIPVRRPVRTRSRSRGRDATQGLTKTQEDSIDAERLAIEARKEVRTKSEANMEQFGGPFGCFLLMITSHFLVYYFYICLQFNKGSLILPKELTTNATLDWAKQLMNILLVHARPTWYAAAIYWIFWISQGIMAVSLPGVVITGFPIPSEGGRRLKYLCNAIASWWVSLFAMAGLHYYGIFRITEIVDNIGPLITVSIISANLVALAVYAGAFVLNVASKDRSGNPFYDFFLGVWLNPRIGALDLKMFAEVRASWIMLFFITTSAAMKQYETYGYVSASMWFMLLAHFLYANAIMKGEDCIPTTWDIFHEKWGWMLIFWNMAGVPFVYTAQSIFILRNAPEFTQHSTAYNVALFTVLIIAYYIWDTTNSQKNRFRMQMNGSYVPRPWAFPQLPWGTLVNPKALPTKVGAPLLIDGWYKYARKVHYTVDILMSLTWTLSCGTCQFIPCFYVSFFTCFLIHRVLRDEERCAIKYGEDWKRYVEIVPYRFIPGVF